MGCGDEKLSKYLTQTFIAHCNAMICQQVTLSGDAEWPKVADAVIEARQSLNNSSRRCAHTVLIFSSPHLGLSIRGAVWKRLIQQYVTGCNRDQKRRYSRYMVMGLNRYLSTIVSLCGSPMKKSRKYLRSNFTNRLSQNPLQVFLA